ncbi:MAG TPA: cytochrome P460 family protein [Ignavibacteria bacterium]
MKNRKLIFSVIAILAITATGYIYFNSIEDPDDKALFQWISSQADYSYYRNDSTILATSKETERAHDDFMRVRLNSKALSVLDSAGKLPKDASFPDSSIIIKEIYSDKNQASPDLFAIIVKMKGDKNSGKDWLWAEYTPSGETEYSVTKNGRVCVKCHRSGDDYVRILKILK